MKTAEKVTKNLLSEIATRNSLGAAMVYGKNVPDPDKILRERNYDYEILRDIMNDPHVMATMQQRKMQVLQMGWEMNYSGDKTIKQKAQKALEELQMGKIMSQMLDAIFYGFSVNEILWTKRGKEIAIKDVEQKPHEWFMFNGNNELRLRKRRGGSFVFEEGLELDENKFILIQHKPTYLNPYGEKVLSRCYWSVKMKRAGIQSWQNMVERYGMPFLIGRYSVGATDEQKDELMQELIAMVEDSIAVFEEGLGIEIKESAQYDVGQIYEYLVDFHNKEISKAVLTVTLTTEVGKVGSYKASEIHKEMLNYLGMTDKKLVERGLNGLLERYCKINFGASESPKVKLQKKENVIEVSPERDKLLSELGVKFSKEYFMKRYNLMEGDLEN